MDHKHRHDCRARQRVHTASLRGSDVHEPLDGLKVARVGCRCALGGHKAQQVNAVQVGGVDRDQFGGSVQLTHPHIDRAVEVLPRPGCVGISVAREQTVQAGTEHAGTEQAGTEQAGTSSVRKLRGVSAMHTLCVVVPAGHLVQAAPSNRLKDLAHIMHACVVSVWRCVCGARPATAYRCP